MAANNGIWSIGRGGQQNQAEWRCPKERYHETQEGTIPDTNTSFCTTKAPNQGIDQLYTSDRCRQGTEREWCRVVSVVLKEATEKYQKLTKARDIHTKSLDKNRIWCSGESDTSQWSFRRLMKRARVPATLSDFALQNRVCDTHGSLCRSQNDERGKLFLIGHVYKILATLVHNPRRTPIPFIYGPSSHLIMDFNYEMDPLRIHPLYVNFQGKSLNTFG